MSFYQHVDIHESAESGHKAPVTTKTGWINAVLIPIKQHLGCCVLLPMAANTIGGSAAAWLATPQAEWTLFAVVPPAVTYGVMKAEQKIHDYRHRHDQTCDHKILTRKNYLKQAALAYVFYAASHLLTHHVLHWGHEHYEEKPKKSFVINVLKQQSFY